MGEPTYIASILVRNNRVDRDFEIDLTPTDGRAFMHLILTGKNGSGKTSTLEFLDATLSESKQVAEMMRGVGPERPEDRVLPTLTGPWPGVITHRNPIYLKARRKIDFQRVEGPTATVVLKDSARLEQFLVNLRTQVAYAKEAEDEQAAQEHERRLRGYEKIFRRLFDEPDLSLEFDRRQIRYRIKVGERVVGFDALPDGFRSALQIWAELYVHFISHHTPIVDAEDWGVALIDELEGHLHLGLQEKLLPFLTQSFPKVQFIVATHSPAVISSIPGAVVYDLSTHTRVISDDLQGLRYGTLMTEHFGISSDFDLQTTAELAELQRLRRVDARTPEQDTRLRELARRLSERSHALALKVWTELEFGEE